MWAGRTTKTLKPGPVDEAGANRRQAWPGSTPSSAASPMPPGTCPRRPEARRSSARCGSRKLPPDSPPPSGPPPVWRSRPSCRPRSSPAPARMRSAVWRRPCPGSAGRMVLSVVRVVRIIAAVNPSDRRRSVPGRSFTPSARSRCTAGAKTPPPRLREVVPAHCRGSRTSSSGNSTRPRSRADQREVPRDRDPPMSNPFSPPTGRRPRHQTFSFHPRVQEPRRFGSVGVQVVSRTGRT